MVCMFVFMMVVLLLFKVLGYLVMLLDLVEWCGCGGVFCVLILMLLEIVLVVLMVLVVMYV